MIGRHIDRLVERVAAAIAVHEADLVGRLRNDGAAVRRAAADTRQAAAEVREATAELRALLNDKRIRRLLENQP